jgi:DNA-binding transcriptional regulator YiaG
MTVTEQRPLAREPEDPEAGLPPEPSDEEIHAAVASDPDEPPIPTAEEAEALLALAEARDRYGVFRLCRSLGISSVEVANRLKVPWTRVRRWERGLEEPDAEARRGLDELARDPVLLARREETRRLAPVALARLEKGDPFGVAALRRRLKLGQAEFSARFGVALTTLRNWEQGRAEPDGAAKVLLAAIAADPELVERAARRAGDRAFLVGEEKEVVGAA